MARSAVRPWWSVFRVKCLFAFDLASSALVIPKAATNIWNSSNQLGNRIGGSLSRVSNGGRSKRVSSLFVDVEGQVFVLKLYFLLATLTPF